MFFALLAENIIKVNLCVLCVSAVNIFQGRR